MKFRRSLLALIFVFSFLSVKAENIAIVEEILEIHPLIQKGKTFRLDSPVGSYQVLLKSREKDKIKCLIFKLPLPNEPQSGELFFLKGKQSCPLNDREKREEVIKDIAQLEVFDIDWDKRYSFKLRITLTKNKEKILTVFIPFPSSEKSYWWGLRPVKIKTEKSGPLVEGDICHIGCSQEKSRCQDCPQKQWTAFMTLNCPGEVSGVCGAEKCGQRGQRACIRMTTYRHRVDCQGMKKYVYCSFGRELECQSNGDLTCR